ncbi:hypothetical protein DFP73DRAFT_592881 [Morchella snyderi]|nr:hypothetical protein DFP73DRAFT_592881 [Morchella snyderi]
MSFGVGIGYILMVTKIGFRLWRNLKRTQEEREDRQEQLTEALGILEKIEKLNRKLEKGKILRQAACQWEVRGRVTFLEYQKNLEKKNPNC